MMHLCPVENCNRKYKTREKLKNHLLSQHNEYWEEEKLPVAISVTNENKKSLEKEKNRKYQEEWWLTRKRELEEAKMHAQQQLKERMLHLEEEQFRLREEAAAQEKQQLEYTKLVQERAKHKSADCVVCMNASANTAAIPCGHKNYCFDCATFIFHNPRPRCALCRNPIQTISKIFE
jgi:hypothetical protein